MIAYCGCVVATSFKVHCGSGSASQSANPKPTVRLPLLATAGAEYQDARYGKGNRVHNLLRRKPNESQRVRCTICSTVRNV